MSDSRVLSVIFHGDAKGLIGASKDGGAAVEGIGGKFATAAKVAAGAAVAIGAAAVGFAVKSAATFAEVGGEVAKLQRYTGLSAEAASRLKFAAQESGVGIDSLTKSLGILSKNSVGTSLDKLKLGLKDAHGQALPLNDQLLKLAQKFQSMPAGAEKNALALKVFGRAGLDMLPFLNKGAAGIADLEKQSDKLGNTLSQKGLDAVKASTAAHREFSAVMEGLQLQVGQYVLPVITKFVTILSELLMPAIKVVGDVAQNYLAPAIDWAFGVVSKVMGDVATFVTGTLYPAVLPTLKAIGDFARDYLAPVFKAAFALVGQVASDLVGFFRDVLVPGIKSAFDRVEAILGPWATKAVGYFDKVRDAIDSKLSPAVKDRLTPLLGKLNDATGGHLKAATALGGAGVVALATQMGSLAGGIGGVITAVAIIPNPILLAIAAIAALTAGVVYLYTHNQKFKESVDNVASALKDGLAKAAEIVQAVWPHIVAGAKAVADYFTEHLLPSFKDAVRWVQDNWPKISEAVTHVMNVVRDIITIVVNVVSALWRAWGDDLLHIVQTVFGTISDTISNVVNVIQGIISFVLDVINGDWGHAWDDILQIVSGVWDEINNEISGAINLVKEVIGGVLSTIAQVWSGVWGGIQSVVSGAVNQVVGFVVGLKDSIAKVASGLWDGLSNGLQAVVSFIADQLQHIIDVVNGIISAANHIPGVSISKIPSVNGGGSGGDLSGGVAGAANAAAGRSGAIVGNGGAPAAFGGRKYRLAEGGVAKHRHGGVFANIAEAGHDEAVVPLTPEGMRPIADAMMSRLRGDLSAGPAVYLTINVEGHVLSEEDLANVVRRGLARLGIRNSL